MKTLSILILLLSVASVGCIPSPRRGAAGAQNPTMQGSQAAASLGGDPRAVLDELETQMNQLGYSRREPAQHNPSLPATGLMAHRFEAQANHCYVVAVIGAPNTDPNLVVRDPQGSTVASHVADDSYPWAAVCPDAAGPYTAVVQMGQTSGEYYFAVYEGPTGNPPDLASFFGASAAATLVAAALDDASQARIDAMDAQLRAEGYARVGPAQGFVFNRGQKVQFDLRLEQGDCYAFASVAGAGAENVDLQLLNADGEPVASDTEASRDALLRTCADHAGTYRLVSALSQGQGAVFALGYSKRGNQRAPMIAEVSDSDLSSSFRLLEADIRSRGYVQLNAPEEGRLGSEQSQDFEVQLEGGECYAVIAVGDLGVVDLDLKILDSRGTEVDRDVSSDNRPVARVCPKQTGALTVRVHMYNGQGRFMYAPYRWPRGTRGPFGLEGLTWVRLSEATSLLSQEGYVPSAQFPPGRGSLTREGAQASHAIELSTGCYAIVAVGGAGVFDIDLALAAPGQVPARDNTKSPTPTVRSCVSSPGAHTLTVQAAKGGGPYFYQVFERRGS